MLGPEFNSLDMNARMELNTKTKIVIAGAGSIGCYAGGCLTLEGRDVTLLLRDRLARPLRKSGMTIADLDGSERRVVPGSIRPETDPRVALSGAGIVLVTVKSHATAEMAGLIARHAPGSIVVSLQNGVNNAQVLREALGAEGSVISGMVPFNVVQQLPKGHPPRFQRTTSGTVLVGDGVPALIGLLDVAGLPVHAHNDMTSVLWSKLVLNMNNALNALSGLPLVEQLADPAWRRLLASQMDEALGAMDAAGISLARIEGVHPKLIPFALRLPTALFKLVARKMLAIAPDARSSMWEDFEQGRKTEIDYLQGAVVDLARLSGREAPVCERIVALVKQREQAGRRSGASLMPGMIMTGGE